QRDVPGAVRVDLELRARRVGSARHVHDTLAGELRLGYRSRDERAVRVADEDVEIAARGTGGAPVVVPKVPPGGEVEEPRGAVAGSVLPVGKVDRVVLAVDALVGTTRTGQRLLQARLVVSEGIDRARRAGVAVGECVVRRELPGRQRVDDLRTRRPLV